MAQATSSSRGCFPFLSFRKVVYTMSHPSRLRPGQRIGGRYEVIAGIGEGGMSRVYLAADLKLPGKQWAVKETPSRPELLQGLQDEAELLISLNHPRLPRIVDFFASDEEGFAYLVMDFIQGVTLEKYFKENQYRLPAGTILQIANQLLEVLEYLHEHEPAVIFRDLKPSNIMLARQLEVRLIDFGIARNYKQDQYQDTVKLGTVGFAAPEQYGLGQSDARSDLYGLGALMLYLSTGGKCSEWKEGVQELIRPDIPKGMIPIIRRLLSIEPDDRYQSAKEVRSVLDSIGMLGTGPVGLKTGRRPGFPGTLTIAVMGAGSGTGTTHTAIAVAHYLARSYGKVALVEMNLQSPAFGRIQRIAAGRTDRVQTGERKFEVQGVDYWRQTGRADVISLLGGSYDFVVMDLGAYFGNDRLEEFLRADIPIIVGSGAEWKHQDLVGLVQQLSSHPQHKWMYFLPLAPQDAVHRLRRTLGTSRVFSIPLQVDPFDQCDEMDRAFVRIFQGLLPVAERRRKFRFGLS